MQKISNLRPHPRYYIQTGDVLLRAQNTLFRIHRYFLDRESSVFLAQHGIPQPNSDSPGLRPEDMVVHLDVPSDALEKILSVFYNTKYSLYGYTVAEWTTVLELAHNWKFFEVKNLAVRELEKLSLPVLDRVAIYQKFEVDLDVLITHYANLCLRCEPLTCSESEAIGLEATVLIFSAREAIRTIASNDSEEVRQIILTLINPTASIEEKLS